MRRRHALKRATVSQRVRPHFTPRVVLASGAGGRHPRGLSRPETSAPERRRRLTARKQTRNAHLNAEGRKRIHMVRAHIGKLMLSSNYGRQLDGMRSRHGCRRLTWQRAGTRTLTRSRTCARPSLRPGASQAWQRRWHATIPPLARRVGWGRSSPGATDKSSFRDAVAGRRPLNRIAGLGVDAFGIHPSHARACYRLTRHAKACYRRARWRALARAPPARRPTMCAVASRVLQLPRRVRRCAPPRPPIPI